MASARSCRAAMVLGGLTYMLFLLSYFGRGRALALSAAVALGGGAALLWVAEGVRAPPCADLCVIDGSGVASAGCGHLCGWRIHTCLR